MNNVNLVKDGGDDAMEKPKMRATSLYDVSFSSADDLFATEEGVAELRDRGLLDQQVMVDLSEHEIYDSSWRFHRKVSIGKSNLIEWEVPLTKEEKKTRSGKELNVQKSTNQFIGVRGIPLFFQYGATLQVTEDNITRSICRTKAAIEHHPRRGDREYNLSMPLRTPISRMHYSNKEYTRPFRFFEKNPHIELIAERYDSETETWEERKCMECVAKGEHFLGDPTIKTTPRCRATGSLLFCVFELGLMDAEEHEEDDIKNPIKVKWIPVSKANIRQEDGTPLDRPFILRFQGLGASQLSKIGKGQFDIPVILPSHIKEGQPKTCYLPDDSVMSTQEFYDWLIDPKGFGIRSKATNTGDIAFTTMTEIYSAQLSETRYTHSHAPVFRPVELEEGRTWKGIRIEEYVATSLAIMQQEASAAQGDINAIQQLNSISSSKTQKAISGSSENGSNNGNKSNGNGNGKTAASAKENGSKISEKAQNTFSVKKKEVVNDDDTLDIESLPY